MSFETVLGAVILCCLPLLIVGGMATDFVLGTGHPKRTALIRRGVLFSSYALALAVLVYGCYLAVVMSAFFLSGDMMPAGDLACRSTAGCLGYYSVD